MKPDLSTLKSRDGLGQWLNDAGLTGIGVEVGVLSGGNAAQIMSQWSGQLLHLVDPWEKIDPTIYKEAQGWSPEVCYEECQKLAARYPMRIKLHKMLSMDAALMFPNGSLDWVYIDANHSYDAVINDLMFWWPGIKAGGLLGLHDYRNDTSWPQHCEVKRAVDDWRGNNPVHHTNVRTETDPGWCGSVWFIKP